MEGVMPEQFREPYRVSESVNQESKNATSDINLQTLHGDLKNVQGEVQKIHSRLDALSHNYQPVCCRVIYLGISTFVARQLMGRC